jgi:hypothetical protein
MDELNQNKHLITLDHYNFKYFLEGLSRLVRIPALHAGGHGFKSHPLHSIHGFIQNAFILKK